MGRETRERLVLALGDDLGSLADHDHEEGDQRRGEQHDDAGEQVHGKDNCQDADGDQGGHHKLGEILAVVGIQRFDSLDRGRGQLAGTLAAGVGRAQLQDMVEEPLA